MYTEPTATLPTDAAQFIIDLIAEQTGTTAQPTAPFVIDTTDRAEWLLAKLATLDAERERITANTAKRVAELQADREGLLHRFGAQLEAFARQEAERRRRKTVTLANGTIAFRAVPARLAVSDWLAAKEAAQTVCPAAVVVETETSLDRAVYIEAARARLAETATCYRAWNGSPRANRFPSSPAR